VLKNHKSTYIIFFVSLILTAIIVGALFSRIQLFKNIPDAGSYIAMAEGSPEKVLVHHAKRILHPMIVGRLGLFIGIDRAFIGVGILSLFLLLFVTLTVLVSIFKIPLFHGICFLFAPMLLFAFENCYIQDLFYFSLLSVYFWLLIKERYIFSLLLLCFLFLTREVTIILAISSIIAGLIKMKTSNKQEHAISFILPTFLVSAATMGLLAYLTRNNTNMHNMSNTLFTLFRAPLFLIRNLTGIKHWVDGYASLPLCGYTHEPIFVVAAPGFIKSVSNISQIGIYEWAFADVLVTIFSMLTLFSIGPAIIFYFVRHKKIGLFARPYWFIVAYIYGLISFLLTPSMGPAGWRYLAYSWPLFWLILPFLIKEAYDHHNKGALKLVFCYGALSWAFYFFSLLPYPSIFIFASGVMIVIALHIFTYYLLKRIA